MSEYQNVHVSVEDRVAVLAVDHPPVNTLDTLTFTELNAALDEMLADEGVKDKLRPVIQIVPGHFLGC